jgi:hypothetical protein
MRHSTASGWPQNGQVNSVPSFGAAIDLEVLDFLFPMAGGSAEADDGSCADDEASLQPRERDSPELGRRGMGGEERMRRASNVGLCWQRSLGAVVAIWSGAAGAN